MDAVSKLRRYAAIFSNVTISRGPHLAGLRNVVERLFTYLGLTFCAACGWVFVVIMGKCVNVSAVVTTPLWTLHGWIMGVGCLYWLSVKGRRYGLY